MDSVRIPLCLWATCGLLVLCGAWPAARASNPEDVADISLAKTIRAIRLTSPVTLDGVLDESAWQRPSVAPLIQNDPDNGRPPRLQTDWWVAYDSEAFYLACRLHDAAPESIDCDLGRRDTWPNSDWIYLNLDTFNDDRNGYSFSLSPAGVRGDAIMYNDGWTDGSWDGVWDYGVCIDDQGWAAEIRIPFSQLSFPGDEEQTWGINFSRRIRRYRERDELFHNPRDESGYMHRFPDLVGIKGIRPGRPLEVLAYGIGKGEFLEVDENNPFEGRSEMEGNLGADLKWGLASNLTLNATINPDFAQVEVDPAVVNLSDYETFFPERRPFFVQDANMYNFGCEGTNNNWGFNWTDPMLFYSRRIGRAPTLSLGDNDYAEVPGVTTILGAGKLSGQMGTTSIGLLSAVTAQERAELELNGERREQIVEPLTNYSVLRMKRASSSGRHGLGLMATSTLRDLRDARSRTELTERALAGGIDGWTTLDDGGVWAMRGHLSASHVAGDARVIDGLQTSSRHYFQRPDADHLDYDPRRTSLSGWAGRLMLNKQSGNFTMNTALGGISPGYEISDVGYQWHGDNINYHLVTGYRLLEPTKHLRSAGVSIGGYHTWDFAGNPNSHGACTYFDACLNNYMAFWGNAFFSPERVGLRYTRGGPSMRAPASQTVSVNFDTDGRKKVYLKLGGGGSRSDDGSASANGDMSLVVRPRSSLRLEFAPEISWTSDRWQWVGNIDDPLMEATYGTRCVFGELEYRRCSLTTRVDWTFSPGLTLQAYVQPLLASGAYRGFKELAYAGTRVFNVYGRDRGSTIAYDEEDSEFLIDPDGAGSAEAFTLANPDFNFKSLKVNMVLRWEYHPGSTFYLVWTQGRTDFGDPGDFRLGRDTESLFAAPGEDIVMLKMTHWFDF